VVTTLTVLARSVGKRVALIVLPVSAQFAAAWGESTIRIVFALNAAGWGSHSLQHRYPQHLLGEKINHLFISTDPDEIKRVKVHPIKCPNCKLTVIVEPSDKVCPLYESSLSIPAKR
jgi:hypothetical protein